MATYQNGDFVIEDGVVIEYTGEGGEVIIPYGVKDIFFEAFYEFCLVESVMIPGTILEVSPFVFEGCCHLKEVTLEEGVYCVGSCSFNNCEKLETINLPKSIACLESKCFSNCPSLKEINYAGKKEEWETVIKGEDWDNNTGKYNINFDYMNV